MIAMQAEFLGAAGTVTGSRTLLTHAGGRMLVDCGLFQGFKNLRLLNWEPPPFDVTKIPAIALTHAHLDHSGALPLLARQGFRGRIFASPATIDVCRILLPDSARLQEEEAEYLGRRGKSRHARPQPLYTEQDAERVLQLLEPLDFGETVDAPGGFRLRLQRAGHILGAASVQVEAGGTTILFSGDLGRPDDRLMLPAEAIGRADHVVIESTYGDRLHGAEDPEAAFGEVIRRTVARGGIVVVPAFAVGRAQSLLHAIYRLKAAGRVPDIPVYLNSPMAIDMTALYQRHRALHRLSVEECEGMCRVATMVHTAEQSKALNALRDPAVIIAGSGMATGGRVLHHLKGLAPDPRNSVVFAGFQAGGTRGARMLAGEPTIRIHGEEVPVRAEVISLPGYSAHADAAQLLDWLRTAQSPPRAVYLNHGEPAAADALRQRIERELGWKVTVPRLGQRVALAVRARA
jgi:metallo-beta-lactamase family protein